MKIIKGNKPTLIVPDELYNWDDIKLKPKKIRPNPLEGILNDEVIVIGRNFQDMLIKIDKPANYDDILGKYFK